MKKFCSFFLGAVIMASLFPFSSVDAGYVSGYYRSNGTYVQPYYRSDADSSFYNNWSTWGNYNPYTGKRGYKKYNY